MVQAMFGCTVVAESSETVIVEGNHYFPPESILVDLTISDTTYTCPYKGHASYYNSRVHQDIVKDVAWMYPQPTSKFEIKGRYAFDKARVRVISCECEGTGTELDNSHHLHA